MTARMPLCALAVLLAATLSAHGVRAATAAAADSAAADSTHAAPAERPFVPITYADSATTVNSRCVVSGSHLNARIAPVYVNGQPVGFC